MVHTNMHGNDWGRRHRSVATFLASIMMREKIIWRVVGVPSPPSLNDCTRRARPGAATVNAPRRGRRTEPCKRSAAAGRGSRRRRVGRPSSYRRLPSSSLPARSRKLAGLLLVLDVARNLPRLVIHVAGLWSSPMVHFLVSLKSYPFAILSLHFSQDSVSFAFPCYRFKSEQLGEGATNV
jgi:hypothetical protein